MTITINSTTFINSAGNDFIYDYFLDIAKSTPEHQFIFIISPAADKVFPDFQNIIHIISSPRANNPLMWKIWLNYTLPGIAKNNKADILINTNGTCPLRASLPQLLFISDLSFLHFPQFFSKKQLSFVRKNMQAFLSKATSVITASEYLFKQIVGKYPVDENKIKAFHFAAGQYQPIDWKEKEVVKEKYAEGKEYFLYSGDVHPKSNLLNLLKAFSFFKKRQKSNMQLIIVAKSVSANDAFIENFKTYKYRKEVSLLTDLPEQDLAKITAAAYAFVYPVFYEGTAIPLLQAAQCDVPVVASNIPVINEVMKDAFLNVDPANFEDIAAKMMFVFKDENKRNELIGKGRVVIRENNNAPANDLLWNIIQKTGGFKTAQ